MISNLHVHSIEKSISQINCSNISINDYDKLVALKNKYDSLSTKQKKNISNYDNLQAAYLECLQLKKIENFDMYFNQGSYYEALECFLNVYPKVNSYITVCNKMYDGGVNLFELKEYSLCKKYFSFFEDDYRDSDKYLFLSDLLLSIENKDDVNYIEATNIIMEYSDENFKVADKLLKQKPFSNYVDFLNHKGLYKSDNTFLWQDKFFKYEKSAYINIDESIAITSYMTETIKNISSSDVIEKAEQNDFSCDCVYIDNGKYHCCAHYKDAITNENVVFSFDLSFRDDKIVISSFDTTENKNNRTFVDGTYTKIE